MSFTVSFPRAVLFSVLVHGLFFYAVVLLDSFSIPDRAQVDIFEVVVLEPSNDSIANLGKKSLQTKRLMQVPPSSATGKIIEEGEEFLGKAVEDVEIESIEMGEDVLTGGQWGRAPQTVREHYLATVREKILRRQFYPPASRHLKEEGQVQLLIILDRKGAIHKIELIEPSPHRRLNDAALRAVAQAAPFDEFPNDIKYDKWRIQLPVRFELN